MSTQTVLLILARAAVFAVLLLVPAEAGADAAAPRQETYPTTDGLYLSGTWYGDGSPTVVLAHMRPDTQADWAPFARRLAGLGYRAFTFDFRGYGHSDGEKDTRKTVEDLRATLDFVRANGGGDIVLIGGSMGAMAAAKVAAERPVAAAVLMAPFWDSPRFAGPAPDDIRAIGAPILFMSAEQDNSAQQTREMAALAASPDSRIKMYSGRDHGRRLLERHHAADASQRILDFLARHAPPGD